MRSGTVTRYSAWPCSTRRALHHFPDFSPKTRHNAQPETPPTPATIIAPRIGEAARQLGATMTNVKIRTTITKKKD